MGNLCHTSNRFTKFETHIGKLVTETSSSIQRTQKRIENLNTKLATLETDEGKRMCRQLITQNTEFIAKERAKLEMAQLAANRVPAHVNNSHLVLSWNIASVLGEQYLPADDIVNELSNNDNNNPSPINNDLTQDRIPVESKDTITAESKDIVTAESKDTITAESKDACVVCMNNEKKCAIVPCGHRCLCYSCSRSKLATCPICRKIVSSIIAIY